MDTPMSTDTDEIEYWCMDCKSYFEAPAGGADCPFPDCESSETVETAQD